MTVIAIVCEQRFPYYDIKIVTKAEEYEAKLNEMPSRLSEEDYAVYKGLLVQMERLQKKLHKLYELED